MKKDLNRYKDTLQKVGDFSSHLRSSNINNEDDIQKLRDMISDESALLNSIAKYSDVDILRADLKKMEKIDGERDKSRELLMRSLKSRRNIHVSQKSKGRVIAAISSIAAALLFLSYWLFSDDITTASYENIMNEVVISSEKEVGLDIERPTLVLEDGENVDLVDFEPSLVADKKIEVNTSKNNIRYSDLRQIDNIAETKRNTIKVPHKYSYTVTLADSTIVYVSANSELTYPVAFNGERREVELTGMAFFDVKKGDKPFVVKVNGVEVNVYGTRFNINAYESDKIETTLISGSVGVRYQQVDGSTELKIEPNEQVLINTLSGEGKIVKDVDTSAYTSWLDGYFVSNSQSVAVLLKLLANWYGVEFRYELGTIEDIKVSGSLSRETSIDELLAMIELITDVKFNKEGNIFYVESVK